MAIRPPLKLFLAWCRACEGYLTGSARACSSKQQARAEMEEFIAGHYALCHKQTRIGGYHVVEFAPQGVTYGEPAAAARRKE